MVIVSVKLHLAYSSNNNRASGSLKYGTYVHFEGTEFNVKFHVDSQEL